MSGAAGADVVTVAPGVHAYVQPRGGWCVSNAGVISGPGLTVVIDTLATERRARALRAFVDQVSSSPERLLVNTHCHGDHIFGNHVFGPQPILAHTRARDEALAAGLSLTKLWPDADWGDVRVTLPNLTFTDRVTVHTGERPVELIHAGVAHTTNDVVAWLPEDRVLFAGDVVMSGVAPFSLYGSVTGTMEAIGRLRALDPVTVVCGHGPPRDQRLLDDNLAYLEWILELASDGLRSGKSPAQVGRERGGTRFTDLIDSERVIGNLHRAYADLAGVTPGAELDMEAIFAEMVEYRGSYPVCLALRGLAASC
jgi:cyclase